MISLVWDTSKLTEARSNIKFSRESLQYDCHFKSANPCLNNCGATVCGMDCSNDNLVSKLPSSLSTSTLVCLLHSLRPEATFKYSIYEMQLACQM